MLTRLIRLRLARPPRSLRAFTSHPPADLPPLPPLSALHLPETPLHPFPLYKPPPPPASSEPLPTSLDGLPSDRALQVRQKVKLTQAVEAGVPEYTEDELRAFYAAVVTSGEETGEGTEEQVGKLGGPSRLGRLESGAGKGKEAVRVDVLSGLRERFASDSEEGAGRSALVQRKVDLKEVVEKLARIAEEDESSGSASSSTGVRVLLGLISRLEGRTLLQEAANQGDAETLVDLLEVLPRLGVLVERDQIVQLLHGVTSRLEGQGPKRRGLSEGEEEVVAVLASVMSQQTQLQDAEQDALVRVHLLSDPSATRAIAHLRQYESLALPAPQSSYNLILHHLTHSSPTSITRSTAWDLFTHMRLVAYPTPLPAVYTTMISSCAASSDPRPEMARDLWIQMTQEQRISPTEPEYTAYIRALCSTRGTYLEGFDVFRQMLARHHEVTYVPFARAEGEEMMSRYVPTNGTWKALLEGTKRAGDLARARWVLQECVRLHGALGGQRGMGVDEEVMASVFMTYAAWKPTLRRVAVKEKEIKEASETRKEIEDRWDETDGTADSSTDLQPSDRNGMFAARVPTTSAEAVYEASLLFDALLPCSSPPHTIFSDVHLSTRLINSFASVTYAHAPDITACRAQWGALTPLYPSPEGRNGWSFLHALERCAVGQRGRPGTAATAAEDRAASLAWAKELWEGYEALTQTLLQRLAASPSQAGLAYSLGISPRQVERCWRAIIRTHALSGNTTTALSILTQFHTTHPPGHITDAYAPTADHGFSVRFTDPTTVAEADVPPHLLWRDVDVLHQRLVRDERWSEVGRVKWVCAAYEAALGRRRRWRLDGVGRRRMGKGKGKGVDRVEDAAQADLQAEWGLEEGGGDIEEGVRASV